MEINQIVAWAVSFVIGIGAVSAFIAKYAGKAKKAISIAKEAIDTLDTVLKAVEDSKVDALEVEAIRKEANELMAAIKAIKS